MSKLLTTLIAAVFAVTTAGAFAQAPAAPADKPKAEKKAKTEKKAGEPKKAKKSKSSKSKSAPKTDDKK